MYKVLLVDDEYMVTEGLKRLIPFDKWDMEVVATASHADEALEYVQGKSPRCHHFRCQYARQNRA